MAGVKLEFQVAPAEAGRTLAAALRRHVPGLTWSRARGLCARGKALVDGAAVDRPGGPRGRRSGGGARRARPRSGAAAGAHRLRGRAGGGDRQARGRLERAVREARDGHGHGPPARHLARRRPPRHRDAAPRGAPARQGHLGAARSSPRPSAPRSRSPRSSAPTRRGGPTCAWRTAGSTAAAWRRAWCRDRGDGLRGTRAARRPRARSR